MKLTGCLSTNLLSPGEGPNPTHGTLMAPGLNAQVIQQVLMPGGLVDTCLKCLKLRYSCNLLWRWWWSYALHDKLH